MQKVNKNKIKKDMYKVRHVIARNLRLLRSIKGVSQENVAHMLHMSRSSYNALESGAHMPDFITLCKLSSYYDVSLDYLLTFDISEHIMSIIRKEKSEADALDFMSKYLHLSRGGKLYIRKRINELKDEEDKYNIFPWDYECRQEEVK